MAIDYEALVEKIAFGRSSPKLSSCLGMYLSPEIIYLSETRLEKGRPVISHLVRVPVPAPDKPVAHSTSSTLNTDFLSDTTKLGALIRQAMSQIRWNSKNVILTLSHQLSLLRFFSMPKVERRFWETAIPMEAKKYIPIPFNTISYDYQVVDIPPGVDQRARQGALVAVTPNKNLPQIKSLLQGLGLTLLGVEVAPCSVLRTWNSLEGGKTKDPFGQVHFDGGNIRILVSDKGVPVFFREVFLGSALSLQDNRKLDVAGCVGFSQKQLGVKKLTEMRVSGNTAELPRWREQIAKDLGMTVTMHDTAGLLGIKAGDWGGYASIGASLKHLAPTALSLDLANVGRVSPTEKIAAKNILLLGIVLTFLFLLMGGYRQLSYQMKVGKLNKLAPDASVSATFAGLDAATIEIKIANMEKQADLLAVVPLHRRNQVHKMILELNAALPEKAWLKAISFETPLKGGRGFMLRMEGSASGETMTQEQDLAYEFRRKLTQSELIGKLFPDLKLTVTGRPLGPDVHRGIPQEEMRRKIEARTSFSLIGKVKE